jgi:acyl-CoA thioesterase
MKALQRFFDNDQFARRANVKLLSVAPGRATAQMVLQPYHQNGMQNVQGGAIFTLADFTFAAAANSHGTVAVAVNVSITFMKAAKAGVLHAEAKELSKNFRLGSYLVEVRDDAGDLVAVFQGLAYRKQEPIPRPDLPDASQLPGDVP